MSWGDLDIGSLINALDDIIDVLKNIEKSLDNLVDSIDEIDIHISDSIDMLTATIRKEKDNGISQGTTN